MKKKQIYLTVGILIAIAAVGIAIAFVYDNNSGTSAPQLTGISQDEIALEPFSKKFPLQYESYLSSQNMDSTEYSGSFPKSKFEADMEPLLPILFSGSGFSTEYKEDRGHYFALTDLKESKRVNEATTGSCLSCKSTAVPALTAKMGDSYWTSSLLKDVYPAGEAMHQSAVGCSTCHKPNTMELTVTRPSFIKKMSEIGVDLSKATQKEMEDYVCAQCHVEYYFSGDKNEVIHPWNSGFKAIEGFMYYSGKALENGFEKDYVSTISGAAMLKAQHPDYETYKDSTHASNGVTCADCHMPKVKKDGKTYSSHQMTSPNYDLKSACGSCHKDLEEKKAELSTIQKEFKTTLLEVEAQLVKAHYYVNRMITSGCSAEDIQDAQMMIRFGQWFMDYNASENSTGFHNPEVSKDNFRIAQNAIKDVMTIAEPALRAKNVNFSELDAQIDQTIQNVKNEPDHEKKNLLVNNEWFPSQAAKK